MRCLSTVRVKTENDWMEYLSKKKNPNTSVDDLADDINPLEKPESNVVDDVLDIADDVAEGGTEIDFDLSKLSRSQQKSIESADNIINDHLKSSDLSAALDDLQGNPIAKPNGGYWNHAQEVKDAYLYRFGES